MSDPRRPEPSGRPRRWQWVLTALFAGGTLISGIASNVLADVVNRNFGSVAWATAGVALVVAGVLAVLEFRGRLADQRDGAGEPKPAVPTQPPGIPTDLPRTSGFVGRRGTVSWLVEAIAAERAVALVGRRAVGTSSCVVEAANEVRADFPDGQLYLDLRPRGRPMRAPQVLRALCRRLGVDPDGRTHADAARALRDRIGERRLLIVLDNVRDPAQVRPLLPPAPRCRLLMAGTAELTTLAQVRVHRLHEPTVTEAVDMFAAAAVDAGWTGTDLRLDAAVRDLVTAVGRQPHAVRVLGSRMAGHGLRPASLLTSVRTDRPGLLAVLAARDRAYAALGRPARRVYRLLALVEHPLGRGGVAALAGFRRGRIDRLLDELAAAAFVTPTPDGRLRIREPLVGYARIHLATAESARRQAAARARLVRHLARRAEQVSDELPDPGRFFRRNDALLHTVRSGPWVHNRWWLRLAVATCDWYAGQGQLDEWAAVCQATLDSPAARRRSVAGWARNELGVNLRQRGEPHRAVEELMRAVALRRRRGAAQSGTNLGLALLDRGDVDAALDQLQRAARQRAKTDRAGQARTALGLGAAFLTRGEPLQARHHLVAAANMFDTIGDRRGYAAALVNLVLAQWWLGERLDAAHAWTAALRHHDRTADPRGHAEALLNAGAAMVSAGTPGPARECLLASLRLRAGTGQPTGRVLLHLGDAAAALDDRPAARRYWSQAAEACAAAKDADAAAAVESREL